MKKRTQNKKTRKQAEALKNLSYFHKLVLNAGLQSQKKRLQQIFWLVNIAALIIAVNLSVYTVYAFIAFAVATVVSYKINLIVTLNNSIKNKHSMMQPTKLPYLIEQHKQKPEVKAKLADSLSDSVIINLLLTGAILGSQYIAFTAYNMSYLQYIGITILAIAFMAVMSVASLFMPIPRLMEKLSDK
tara:strand:- start:18 stop:578 length:561 start_codon:yes stop_codon:yes gene_type:complete